MAIVIKDVLCIQDDSTDTTCPVSILPGDTVELEMKMPKKSGMKNVCLIKNFCGDTVDVWDLTTDTEYKIDLNAIKSFRILLRGYKSAEMFGNGENLWKKFIDKKK